MENTKILQAKLEKNNRQLSTKQQHALSDFLASRQAGHCFFRPEDFVDEPDENDFCGHFSAQPGHPGQFGEASYGASSMALKAKETVALLKKSPTMASSQLHDLEHSHHHGHHSVEPSIITAVASGIINYILMFGFCCTYGMIIFTDDGHYRHRGLGIKLSLATAMIMGLLLSLTSNVDIAIGGPDMNAVIFISGFVERISKEIRSQLDLVPGDAGPDKNFCVGDHYQLRQVDCDDYHEQLRATTIFSVTASSAALAFVFLFLGVFKLTKYVAYVPTSIVDAFLSCMGYKVFKYGLKLCKYDPRIFIPAAAVGVPLYFFKALHMGKPMYVIPAFLFVPVGIFYFIVYAAGGNVESARSDKWMFEWIEQEDFWNVWGDGFFKRQKINFKAWTKTLVHLGIMLVVCLLDALVTSLRTTEAKLSLKIPHKNYEISLSGAGNIIGAFFSSAAGYMQLKFNIVNSGVLGNVKDRRSGILYALAISTAYFGPIGHINYLPRLFIGMLLFFGGAAFVAEHLWGSKEYLSFIEWVQVFMILGVFIFTGEIVYAMLLGAVMCGVTFIAKYAKIPCIAGRPMRGGELQSREQHTPLLAMSLSHIANSWLLVIRLKGFVFFASVQTVTEHVRKVMQQEEDNEIPHYRRIKFVLLDCELLDGLDSSAEKDLQQLRKDLMKKSRRILWSNLEQGHADAMMSRGTLVEDEWFNDLDDALLYIEGMCLHFRKHQSKIWERLHPSFALAMQLTQLRESYEPFIEVLRLDIERFGCPWDFISRAKIRTCKTILWSPNEVGRELFLVHTGAVGLFTEIPQKDGQGTLGRPLAIYRHGWFLNREFLMQAPTRHYAVALEDGEVIYWTEHEWWRMHREQPLMASAIIESAMRQAASDMERVAKNLRSSTTATVDENVVAQLLYQSRSAAHEQGVRDEDVQLPEYLEARLMFMSCAQSLESYGLYDPVPKGEQGVLPELPQIITHDLEVAFRTYSVNNVLPWEKVNEALMYAGIFNTLLVHAHKVDELTQKQFMEVGHEAALMRLSNKHILKIYNVFKQYQDADGQVNRDGLIDIFRASFVPQISEQEVNGISTVFDVDGSGAISAAEFMGIVSRFARRHEQDWNLLRGLRHLLQKGPKAKCVETDVLTANKLLRAAEEFRVTDLALHTEEAEEMLWCAACYCKLISASQQGKMLDFCGVAAAVVLSVEVPWGKLPPEPIMTDADKYKKGRGTIGKVRCSRARQLTLRGRASAGTGTNTVGLLAARSVKPGVNPMIMPTRAMKSEKKEKIHLEFEKQKRITKSGSEKIKSGDKKKGWGKNKAKAELSKAKQLFQRAREKLIARAAEIALEAVGLRASRYEVTSDLVMDLRTTCSYEAGPQMFFKARLSVHDFKTEKEEEELRRGNGIHACQIIKKGVPDTPDAKIHLLLEDPDSTPAAKLWSVIMGAVIVASVFCLVLKGLIDPDGENSSDVQKKVFKVLECCFTIIFLSELVLRFAVADALGNQTRLDFIQKPMNICDLCSVAPFFIELAVEDQGNNSSIGLLRVARLLRLARVMRIARLAKGKSTIFGPCAAVFTIIWGIYLKENV